MINDHKQFPHKKDPCMIRSLEAPLFSHFPLKLYTKNKNMKNSPWSLLVTPQAAKRVISQIFCVHANIKSSNKD